MSIKGVGDSVFHTRRLKHPPSFLLIELSSIYKMDSVRTTKKMIGFVSCLLVSTAFACAPLSPTQNDTTMSNTVTMVLRVNPIIRWTYFLDSTTPGQPGVAGKAKTYLKNDIDQAIKLILADNKMDTNALPAVVENVPTSCNIVDKADCAANVDDGCVTNESGAVTETCSTPPTEVINEITINLTAKIPVSSTDWQRLAYKIREKLEAKNVLFEEDIDITF